MHINNSTAGRAGLNITQRDPRGQEKREPGEAWVTGGTGGPLPPALLQHSGVLGEWPPLRARPSLRKHAPTGKVYQAPASP